MTPALLFDDVLFMFDPTFFPVGEDPGDGVDVLGPMYFPVGEDPSDDVDALVTSGAICTTR